MALPLFASENFANVAHFTGHAITANEEASGAEVFRVGTGRRSARNKWMPTTLNQDAWIKVTCDRPRAFDFFALDRGHNLDGKTIRLEASNDDFGTSWTVFESVLPSSVFAPADVRSAPGVKTEEGAYLRRFPLEAARDIRLVVPAMGAGLRPEVIGLYVGQSWEPSYYQELPFSFGGRDLIYEETVSDTAWVGASRPAQRYRTDIHLKLKDYAEYDLARYHIETLAWRRRLTWYVPDQAQAERSWLGVAPPGSYRFEQAQGWGYMQARFPLVEHEPRLAA